MGFATTFQSLLPELAGYLLAPAHPPEPDIVATGAGDSIGIELTHMRGIAALSVHESEKALVVRRACELVTHRTRASTAVRVDWAPGIVFTKENREALSAKLAHFVEAHLPPDGTDLVFGPPFVAESDPSDPELSYVSILREDAADESDWDGMDNWDGATAEPPFVQTHIDRKKSKPAKYLVRYTQRWLLLIHEGYKPSSGYELGATVRLAEFRSSFDRVFVLSLTPGAVTELHVAASDSAA
jgi:hypothetical protein